MPSFTQAELNVSVATRVTGTYSDANFLIIANNSARELVRKLDLRSMKRRAALSPNLMDDIFDYSAPSDIKGNKLIDLQPQIDRGRFDDWRLTTEEEFDRLKSQIGIDRHGDPVSFKRNAWVGDSVCAVSDKGMTRKILAALPVDDTETVVDSLDAIGNWVLFGDAENLTADASNFVKGSRSINWDISSAGGTTAGIQNTSLATFDLSAYLTEGSIFVWAYLSSKTNVTNFIIRIGSGTSAYYSITITTNNEGNAFVGGWNLLRFDFVNKSTTGTPDDDASDYVAVYMTKDSGKVSETDYRFDHIILKVGKHYDVVYYSKYAWQSSAGTYLEDATATTDLLNADTDEINLFELKTAELIERHLKHLKESQVLKDLYDEAVAEYVLANLSVAMSYTNTYHNFERHAFL